MTLPRRTLAATMSAGLLLLPGCKRTAAPDAPEAAVPPEPGWTLQRGRVDLARSSNQALAAPISARVGAPFTVTINTLGSSSCTRADGARVARSGMMATVTPLDWEAPSGTSCTRDLRVFPHAVTLRFDTGGEATVRVLARDPRGEPVTYDLPVRIER